MVVRVDYISSCVANNILGFHLSSAAEFGQNDLDYNGERVTSKRKRRRLSRQSSCLFHFTSPHPFLLRLLLSQLFIYL